MDNLICFLQKWQTLVATLISGIFALMVALIVAWDARRREEKASAMLLLTDLQEVKIASEALSEIMKREETKPEEKARSIAIRLLGDPNGWRRYDAYAELGIRDTMPSSELCRVLLIEEARTS